MRIYLDTNVYLSKYKDEFYSGRIPAYAGYKAEELLERALECEFFIVTSDLISREIERTFPYYEECFFDDIKKLDLRNKLTSINSKSFYHESVELDKRFDIGRKDCAHLLIAKQEADVFVSWETKLKRIGKKLGISVLRPDEF